MVALTPTDLLTAFRIRNHSGLIWGTGFGLFRPDTYNSDAPHLHADLGEMRLWIVTCAHVVDAIEASQVGSQQLAHIEVNESSEKGGIVPFSSHIATSWTRHPEWVNRCTKLGPISQRSYTADDAAVDVAVNPFQVSVRLMGVEGAGFIPAEHLTKVQLSQTDPQNAPILEGTEVFVIGFPAGYYTDVKNWPVVRTGVLAQIRPYLYGSAKTFLIDGSVFGGNSGGPVVIGHQSKQMSGAEPPADGIRLIGMVSGSVRDPITGENSDLGVVVPLDTINETVTVALPGLPSVEEVKKNMLETLQPVIEPENTGSDPI